MVSHHVLVLVHLLSVRGLALWLSRKVHGFKTIGFSAVITDINLFVLGYSSCPLSLLLKDSLPHIHWQLNRLTNVDGFVFRSRKISTTMDWRREMFVSSGARRQVQLEGT